MDRSPSAIQAAPVLAREPYDSDGPRWVVARAEDELVERYGLLHQSEQGLDAAMFDPPAGAFLVARRGDAAGPVLGGVGLRVPDPELQPAVGEVRRLWVDPGQRRLGVAQLLMAGLEDAARELGLLRLRLITGDQQPEAIALYASSGWELASGGDPALEGYRFTKTLEAFS